VKKNVSDSSVKDDRNRDTNKDDECENCVEDFFGHFSKAFLKVYFKMVEVESMIFPEA
jgi:hypothetical protein